MWMTSAPLLVLCSGGGSFHPFAFKRFSCLARAAASNMLRCEEGPAAADEEEEDSNESMVLESRGLRGCGRTRTFAGLSLSIVNSDTGDVFSTGLEGFGGTAAVMSQRRGHARTRTRPRPQPRPHHDRTNLNLTLTVASSVHGEGEGNI